MSVTVHDLLQLDPRPLAIAQQHAVPGHDFPHDAHNSGETGTQDIWSAGMKSVPALDLESEVRHEGPNLVAAAATEVPPCDVMG